MKDLLLYKKTEQLLYRVYPTLVNYPKAEKFALCSDIKHGFYDLLTCLSLASKVKSQRMLHAQKADAHLQKIKIMLKLSRELKYIGIGFFREIDLELTEIDKMLSSYIRSI